MGCASGGQRSGAAAHGWVAPGSNVDAVVGKGVRRVVDASWAVTWEGTVSHWPAAEVLGEVGVKVLWVCDWCGVSMVVLVPSRSADIPFYLTLQFQV